MSDEIPHELSAEWWTWIHRGVDQPQWAESDWLYYYGQLGVEGPALIALLNYRLPDNHPQKFTREDAWQVDQAIGDAEEMNRPDSQIARLRALAAKIEALLPPEPTIGLIVDPYTTHEEKVTLDLPPEA